MKQIIDPLPPEGQAPYAHLEPIVKALIDSGNEPVEGGFRLDKDGWRCDLMQPIDFGVVRERFLLPPSILLSEQHDSILCQHTWVEIKGGTRTGP